MTSEADMPAGDKRQSGQPLAIRAATWNRMVDATDWYWEQQRLGRGGAAGQTALDLVTVRVKNGTGDTRRVGEVLEITSSPLLDDDQLDAGHLWFNGDTPQGDGRTFGVLRRGAADGDIVPMQLAGVCLALVDVTDADHTRAKLDPGSAVLTSAAAGAIQIVYKPTGTGEKTCCVLLGGSESLRWVKFTLTAALATTDATKSAQVELASWTDDTVDDITVANLDESGGDYVFSGDSGDWGIALHRPFDDSWHILQMECP